MQNSLLLTLGHNSSAIFVYEKGTKIIGYEQERIDGIKASSAFPSGAIAEIQKQIGLKQMLKCDVYISHWFDTGAMSYKFEPSKYMSRIDYENLVALTDNVGRIIFTSEISSHHDAHAYSALAFYKYHITHDDPYRHSKNLADSPLYVLVVDGFGNNKEVFSLYEVLIDRILQPKRRIYNYKASLGLMYQYATSFTGMKENQDEYKYLGYEAYVSNFSSDKVLLLDEFADSIKELILNEMDIQYKFTSQTPGRVIDTKDLKNTKDYWYNIFFKLMQLLSIEDRTSTSARIAVAYVIQRALESTILHIIELYNIENCIVVGGTFYNVKLNNAILKRIKGLFCAMPLAGDQGAAIGMYYKNMVTKYPDYIFPFKSLAIGKRSLYDVDKLLKQIKGAEFVFIDNDVRRNEIINYIAYLINAGNIVNIVVGDMEFGPRALCNTSSLMLPHQKQVAMNNLVNKRNEVMPCAPVLTKKAAEKYFDKHELDRVIGSDKFMICTHDYVDGFKENLSGVQHKKPLEDVYTGRPQIVEEDSFIGQILTSLEKNYGIDIIVNTSFNAHGRPIVFDTMDIIHNFNFQKSNIPDDSTIGIYLYVIEII